MQKPMDFNNIVKAHVYFRGQLAGTLEKKNSRFKFQYHKGYLQGYKPLPIATSLPLEKEEHESDELPPYFDNLIPEGWLSQYVEKGFHIDGSNRFALLMATGKYPIGAVTVHPLTESQEEVDLEDFNFSSEQEPLKLYSNQPLPDFNYCPSCFKLLSRPRAHATCTKAMWGTQKNLSVALHPKDSDRAFYKTIHGGSVSGVQKKGMFRLDSKGRLIPTPKGAQYILKPPTAFSELPKNEHVTMAIAKKIGFEVPPFSVLHIENVGIIFAIKRFDRSGGQLLMMEDMAQITRTPSGGKYRLSCEQVTRCIQRLSSAPLIDLTKFYRRVIFCYFIANGDMHLKNWSLVENPKAEGQWKLSPCYDLLNTRLAMVNESIDIGLPLNGKSNKLQREDFQKLGQRLALAAEAIERPFSELDDWWDVTQDLIGKCLLSSTSKERYLEIVEQRYSVLKT